MSETLDSKVVEMKFDNAQFEAGVSQSLSTLDKLKAGLKLDGASKSLDNISKRSEQVNLTGLQKAIDTVNSRFSALGIVTDQVFRRMTNSVLNFSSTMLKSFTTKPIDEGFKTYESKVKAIQVTLNNGIDSSGAPVTLEKTKKVLADLNEYSDKTIYRFEDMTESLGKFSAAGVNVDQAAKAIKGLGNVAALAGASTNDYSRAIYNVSQALGSGKMLAIDWKSIENANMATKSFKEELIKAGLAAGTLKKEGDKIVTASKGSEVTWKNLRNTLADAWLTSDVLTSALGKYADTTSELGRKGYAAAQEVKTFTQLLEVMGDSLGTAWSKVFENIVGDYEESKRLWTAVNEILSQIFEKPIDELGDFTKRFHDLGGRTKVIETLSNAFFGLAEIIKPVVDGIQRVFPAPTAEQFYNLATKISDITEKFGISEKAANRLQTAVITILSPFKKFITFVTSGISSIATFAKSLTELDDRFIALNNVNKEIASGSIGRIFVNLNRSVSLFENRFRLALRLVQRSDAFKEMQANIQQIKLDMQGLYEKVFGKFAKGLQKLAGFNIKIPSVKGIADTIINIVKHLNSLFDLIHGKGSKLSGILPNLSNGFSQIGNSISKQISKIREFFESIKFNSNQISPLEKIKSIFSNIGTTAKNVFSEIESGRKNTEGLITGASKGLTNLFDGISRTAGSSGFANIISGVNTGIFGALVISITNFISHVKKLLSKKTIEDIIKDSIGGITGSFKALEGCLTSLQKNVQSKTLMNIAKAVAILAGSIFLVSTIPGEDIARSLGAISGAMAALIVTMIVLNKFANPISSGSKKGGIIGAINNFIGSYSNSSISAIGTAMIKMSAAVLILATAMKSIQGVDYGHILMTMATLGSIVASAIILSHLISSKGAAKNIKSAGSAMIEMSAAILILSKAMENIQNVDYGHILISMAVMGSMVASIIALSATIKKVGNGAKITAAGLAMIGMAIGMRIIASAIADISKIGNVSSTIASVVALDGVLAALGIFISTVKFGNFKITDAANIAVIISLIKQIGDSLKQLSTLSLAGVGSSLLALGGALLEIGTFTALVKTTNLTTSDSIAILAISAALVVISHAMKNLSGLTNDQMITSLIAMGGALIELSAALAAISMVKGAIGGAAAILIVSAAFAVLTPQLMLMSSLEWGGIAKGLVMLGGALAIISAAGAVAGIPVVALGLIALTAACIGIGTGTLIAGMGLMSLATGLAALSTIGPAAAASIVGTINIIISGILSAIPNMIVLITGAITTIITAICASIANSAVAICAAVSQILDAIIPLLGTYIPKLALLGLNLISTLLHAIASHIQDFTAVALQIIANFINGIAQGLPAVIQAAFNLIVAFIDGLANAIETNRPKLKAAFEHLIDASLPGLRQKVSSFISIGKNYVTGLINGLKSGIGAIKEKAANIGQTVKDAVCRVLGINSPSREADWQGRMYDKGLANGVTNNGGVVDKAAEKVANKLKAHGDDALSYIYKSGSKAREYMERYGITDSALKDDSSGANESTAATQHNTEAINANTEASTKNAKAKETAGKATKENSKAQKELADFMKYSSQVIGEFAQTYGGAMGLVENVSPMLAAQGAFGELCEEIYQESKDASDSTQDATDDAAENAQDRIAEVQKAFVQAFTKIKEQVSSGMDFFTKFDSKVSEAMTPDEILRNADSQVQGYSRFYTRVMNLGLKGFNKQVIQSILDEGVAAYPKVAGMLKMTADQVEKLNTAFANKEAYATQAATMGMMARMNVILINKLKARLNAEKDVDVEILKEAQAYHDLQASGTASAEDIQNQFNKLTKTCTDHGTTLDAVIKKLQNSHKQVNQEILTAMSNYTELKISGTASAEEIDEAFQVLNQTCIAHGTTVEEATLSVQKYGAVSAEAIQGAIDKMQHAFTVMSEFEDYAEMIGDSVSAAMERAFDPFGEWPDKFELTGEQLMERVQKSFAGMQTYAAQLTRVGISGGQDLIAYFGDKFTPEIANAFSQLSDGQIAQINSMVMSMKNLVQTAGVSASQQWMAQGKLDGMTYQQAFAEYTSQAAFLNTAVQNMGLQFSTAIQPVMTESATQSVNTYITAMSEGFDANAEVVQEDGMKNAALLTDAMATGINDQSGIVMNSGSALSHAVDSAVRNVLSPAAGHSIGSNWVGGIINGIRSRIAEARAAAAELASAISAATAGGLDEHSPSKLSYKFGRFWDEGLVNGMNSGIGIVERSTSSVANTVVDNMREALTTARDILSDDVSTSPVITPVIDLSDAQNGISSLGSMLNANNFKINANLGRITTNADRLNALQASLQTGNAGNGVNINFEQNNYSPTELSRLDIYRQTRNQLAMLKGMVDGI